MNTLLEMKQEEVITMLNTVILMGRMTADAELRTTTSGTSVTQFTMAVDRDYVKSGEERQTDFINVVVWGKTADFVTTYFHKGDMIAVVGSIQVRNYEDKNGNKRYATEVIADKVSFCGGKTERKPAEQPTFTVLPDNANPFGDDEDSGLPF